MSASMFAVLVLCLVIWAGLVVRAIIHARNGVYDHYWSWDWERPSKF